MSNDDLRLKIEALFVDKASAGLKKLGEDVQRLQRTMRRTAGLDGGDGSQARRSAAATVKAVGEIDKAKLASLRQTMGAKSRMAAQERRENATALTAAKARAALTTRLARQEADERQRAEREERRTNAAAMTAAKARAAFTIRMFKQEADERRRADRDERQAADRRAQSIRYLSGLRARAQRDDERAEERTRARLGRAGSRAASGASRITTTGAVAAGVLGAGAVAGIRSLTRSAVSLDTAESLAAVHIYNDNSDSIAQSMAKARALREKALGKSVKLGLKPADLVGGYVEAAQAGVPEGLLESVTELGAKFSKLMGTDLPTTLEQAGKSITILRGLGKVNDADGVLRFMNTAAGLAGQTAASRQEMMSFARTGVGAGAQAGMSVEGTLAFGAAMTSVGAQGQQAARLLNRLPEELSEWSLKAQDLRRKTHRSAEDRAFLAAPRELGFGGFDDIEKKFRASPDSFLFELLGRFRKIQDPIKRMQVKHSLMGSEFGQFLSSAAESRDVNLDTLALAKRLHGQSEGQDYLTTSWTKWTKSFEFFLNQVSSTYEVVKAELGDTLKPYADDLRSFITDRAGSVGSLKVAFGEGLKGLVGGMLGRDGTLKDLLADIFGAGGAGLDAAKVKAFGKGVGAGLRDVEVGVRDVMTAFSGGSGDPEAVGRWGARFLGLSAALKMASPAIEVLKGIGEIALGIAGAATALRGVRFATGGIRGAVGSGLGLMLSRLFTLGLVAEIGVHRAEISNWMLGGIKNLFGAIRDGILEGLRQAPGAILNELTPAPLRRWLGRNAAPGALDDGAGGERRFAVGGYVSGPGGSRSDSIRARLSNGEFVVNADATRRNRDLLEAINGGGVPGFALGGLVGTSGAGSASRFADLDNVRLRRSLEALTDILRRDLDLRLLVYREGRDASGRTLGTARMVRAALGGSGDGLGSGGGVAGLPGLLHASPGSRLPAQRFGGADVIGRAFSGGSTAPSGGAARTFAAKAPGIMARLQQDFGLTREQAAGIVGNLGHESAGFTAYQEGNPRGGGRGGAGWAQWTGPRRRAFEAWATQNGLDPRSDEANYGFLKHELTGSHRRALENLRRQRTVEGATASFERDFEGAGVVHMDRRLGYAQRAYQGNGVASLGGAIPGASGVMSGSGDVVGRIGELRRSGAITGRECVDLVKAYTGVRDSTRTWRRGEGASEGHLQPGTPVATFLNPDGSPSHQYAGGTGGRRGVGRDHAAIFKDYIRDATGQILGMRVMEQFRNSGGPRMRDYMFGQGRGEHNGSNYYAVNGANGQMLGGGRGVAPDHPPMAADSGSDGARGPWRNVPAPGAQGRGGNVTGNVGHTINITNHFQRHHDTEELANQVQRKISEGMRYRSHDVEFGMT